MLHGLLISISGRADRAAGAASRRPRRASAAPAGRLWLLVLAGLCLSFGCPTPAGAVVAPDACSFGNTGRRPGATSLTFSHTTGSLVNGYMVVGVSIDTRTTPAAAVNSVTYGGVSLTLIGQLNLAKRARAEMWGLLSPPVGPNDVVVTMSATVNFIAGAATFSGVDQADPFHDFTAQIIPNVANNTHVTVTVPNVGQDDLVLDTIAYDNVEKVSPNPFPDAGQSQCWNAVTGTGSSETPGAGSIKGRAAGAGTGPVTMGWTQNPGRPTDRMGVLAAVAIRAAL